MIKVGISSLPRVIATGYGPDRADTAAAGMIAGVMNAGAVPVVLPVIAPESAAAQLQGLDALVLAGGQDLDLPSGEDDDSDDGRWVDPNRDRHELALWEEARRVGLPVLGICRGAQLVNHAGGGTLLRHVGGHNAAERHESNRHTVDIESDSELARLTNATSLSVNTIHHQAIGAPSEQLHPVAWSPDGVIEAVELEGGDQWFLGVQWHPELMLSQPGGQVLFDGLVDAATTGRREGPA